MTGRLEETRATQVVMLESRGCAGAELTEPMRLSVQLSAENLRVQPDSSTEPLKGSEMGHLGRLQNRG